jgi:two-component system OmpR family response regulator
VDTSKVLVVEDEENVRYVIASALRLSGFAVTELDSGADALRAVMAADAPWDLVVLDVLLPDIDGFTVCERLRASAVDVPIVFLTARDAAEDRIRGLTIGGDDYLTKPFSVEELVVRVKLILRRRGKALRSQTLGIADILLDDDAHIVRRANVVVPMSPTEYRLLRYLLQNEGHALNRSQIIDRVWDYDFDGESTVVESFVSSLRRKLDPDGELIHTVRGIGYRIGG